MERLGERHEILLDIPAKAGLGLAYTALVLKLARPHRAQPGRHISKQTGARPSGTVEDRWHTRRRRSSVLLPRSSGSLAAVGGAG